MICIGGGFLLYGAAAYADAAGSGAAGGYLERGGYGEGPVDYRFMVEGLAEAPVECQVEIPARQYTDEQAQAVFAGIFRELPRQMLGENESLQRVETALTLPTSWENGAVAGEWESDAPDILDSYGQLGEGQYGPEEGAEVWLRVRLSDGVHQAEQVFPVKVFPRSMTEEQRMAAALEEEIRREAEKDPSAGTVRLPEVFEGRTLHYHMGDVDRRMIPLLGVLLAALFYVRERKSGEEESRKRKRQLMLDHADVVYQLMVFVGAGLTVPRAWERIVTDYEDRKRAGRVPVRPAYEEMAYAQSQMRCGVPEGQAIAEFGRRCRLQPYLKLSSLLEQNRRTGTKNLTQLLQQEMAEAWEQQKTLARRMGEEAGTKLLAPLLLLLLVVMVIIMVPAMMSML